MYRPISASHYLALCVEEPKIHACTKKKNPLRQSHFSDPFFESFVSESGLSALDLDHQFAHSSQTEVAFQKGIAKYFRPLPAIDNSPEWELAFQWVHRIIGPLCSNTSILSLEQVLPRSNLQASPGPLWRTFSDSKGAFLADPLGKRILNEYMASIFNMGGPLTYWGAYLKDELRPKYKVDEEKTRVFMCAPTEHFLALQAFSLDFNERIISEASSLHNPILVGMNMYAGSYNSLYKIFKQFLSIWCSDIGSYDASIAELWMIFVIRLRFESLKPSEQTFENLCAIVNLYRDILYTPVVLPDGTVVWVRREPSGHGNTAIDNSIILLLIYCYAWIVSGAPINFDTFRRCVHLALFGDDSVVGTKEYSHLFNPDLMLRLFTSWGIEVEFAPHLEFLGHFFSWDPTMQIVVPVFPYERMVGSLFLTGDHDFYNCVAKAFGLRTVAFTNKKAFTLVDMYCRWLLETYPKHRDFMLPMYHTEHTLRSLHVGRLKVSSGHPNKFESRPLAYTPETKLMNVKSAIKSSVQPGSQPTNYFSGGSQKSADGPAYPRSNSRGRGQGSRQRSRNNRGRSRRSQNQAKFAGNPPTSKNQGYNRPSNQIPRGIRRGNVEPTFSDAQLKYMAMLCDPAQGPLTRPTDGFNQPTSLVRSSSVFDVFSDFSPGPNYGKYTIKSSPVLGASDSYENYKTNIFNPGVAGSNSWDSRVVPWTSNLKYADDLSPVTGQDARTDRFSDNLLLPNVGYTRFEGSAWPTNAFLGTGPLSVDQNFGLTPTIDLLATGTEIRLPVGQYTLDFELQADTVGSVMGGLLLAINDPTAANLTNEVSFTSYSLPVLGLPQRNEHWFYTVYKNTAVLTVNANIAGGLPNASRLRIFPIQADPLVPLPLNGGDMNTYRPVAHSMLFTNSLAMVAAGGFIAGGCITDDALKGNFFTDSPNQNIGALYEYDSLSVIPGTYTGEHKDGCYVHWRPDDNDDLRMDDPESVKQNNTFPELVISGYVTQSGIVGLSGIQKVGRVIVTTIYEFKTSSPMWDQQTNLGDRSSIEAVFVAMASHACATANGKHWDNIKAILSKAKSAIGKASDFYKANSSYINPLASAALAFL